MLPSPTDLADIVSTFKKASSCRSCGRSPIAEVYATSCCTDNHAKNNDIGIATQASVNHQYYTGPLLVSPDCNHFFCQDCWDKAASYATEYHTAQCPVCRCSTTKGFEPRPVIPSLLSSSSGYNNINDEAAVDQGDDRKAPARSNQQSKTGNKNHSSHAPSNNNVVCNNELDQKMFALLGMLRQMRGAEMDGSVEEVSGMSKNVAGNTLMRRKATNYSNRITKRKVARDDPSKEDSSSEEETELPMMPTKGSPKNTDMYTTEKDNMDKEEREVWEETQQWEKDPNILSLAIATQQKNDDSESSEEEDSSVDEETELPGKSGKMSPIVEEREVVKEFETQGWERDPTILSLATPSVQRQREEYEETQGWEKEVAADPSLPSIHPLWGTKRNRNSGSVSSANKQSSFQQPLSYSSVTRNTNRLEEEEGVVAETPTIRESQVSSIRLSSIKSEGGQKKVPTTENESDDEYGEETEEVPGTNMSPYRNNFGLYSDSPNQLADKDEEEDENEPEEASSMSPIRGTKLYNSQSQSQQPSESFQPRQTFSPPRKQSESQMSGTLLSLEGPRRVSTSPAKVWRNEFGPPTKPEYSPSPSPSIKRRRVDNGPTSAEMQMNQDETTTYIRPWNIQSEPIMSQLTCDVKTCPAGRRYDDITQRNSFTSTGNGLQSPENQQMSPLPTGVRDKNQKLYVTYDVLDPVETNALNMLHEQGFCQLVMDGVKSVTKDHSSVPFPAILITHAVDMPGFENQTNKTVATCYRSYRYLKARALGARIIDARWVIDSQCAGFTLDCDKYKIWNDLESYKLISTNKIKDNATLPESSVMLTHKFDGVTFGLLRGLECKPSSLELDEIKSQSLNSPLRLQPTPITSDEIETLVKCWGGRVTTDVLTLMDILLVDESVTLNQITKGLQQNLKRNNSVSRWSIEKWQSDVLESFIVDGSLTKDYGEGLEVKIPIIRSKWLEDSICLGSLQSLASYCWGILIL